MNKKTNAILAHEKDYSPLLYRVSLLLRERLVLLGEHLFFSESY